eukprot:scaffold41581_cov329-Skeletonema_marinoi.AAC.1
MSSDANEDLNAIREKDRWLQQETDATIAERMSKSASLGRNTADTFETRIAKMPTQRFMDMWQDIVDGNDEWTTRAFFPGQPFRKNEFDRGGEPKAVCTHQASEDLLPHSEYLLSSMLEWPVLSSCF